MKKNILNWMTIVLMAFVCASFVACGGSDDNNDATGDTTTGTGIGDNSFIGTWRKYSSSNPSELKNVIWVFEAGGKMYEHDIDANLNIVEGSTETFLYKAEAGHLYTQKQKEGKQYDWKDEGAYTITGDVMELTKEGKVNRLKKIR